MGISATVQIVLATVDFPLYGADMNSLYNIKAADILSSGNYTFAKTFRQLGGPKIQDQVFLH